MNMVKIKICATRSLEAAQVAALEGADFLGFNFVKNAKRYIGPEKAKKVISAVEILRLRPQDDKKIKLVGVFQNQPIDEVRVIAEELGLDYAQFHGEESPDYVNKIKIKTIKTFKFPEEFNIEKVKKHMQKFKVDYFLVDRIKQGEGPMLNLEKVASLAKEFPLIFAGGLNLRNVAEVIKKVKPRMVDVVSGVETRGKQNLKKIKEFIKNAKNIKI